MAEKILIIGDSGSGKSTASKTLDPTTTFFINVIGKPLPYKGWKTNYHYWDKDKKSGNMVKSWDYETIVKAMRYISSDLPKIKTIVIDDAQYIMSYEFMQRARERGFDKFTEIGQHFFDVLTIADTLREDLIVIFLSHSDDGAGKTKIKTIGKMLDEKITVEGLFTVVLLAYSYKDSESIMKYVFVTNSNGTNTCKSPEGMFPMTIPNDLKAIVNRFNEYNNETNKKEETNG